MTWRVEERAQDRRAIVLPLELVSVVVKLWASIVRQLFLALYLPSPLTEGLSIGVCVLVSVFESPLSLQMFFSFSRWAFLPCFHGVLLQMFDHKELHGVGAMSSLSFVATNGLQCYNKMQVNPLKLKPVR